MDKLTSDADALSTAPKTPVLVAIHQRFLELGSILASQAAKISDFERRLEDLESTVHVHPKPSVTTAALLARLDSIDAMLGRIDRRASKKKR
jgi:hypothetical protein